MIDPGTAIAIGSGIQGLGNALGLGGGGNKAAAKEQGREFDVSNGFQLARLLQSAPLRDKILAIMGNLATTGPQAFIPTDLFNQGRPTSGPLAPMNPNAALGARPQSAFNLPADYQDNSGPMQGLLRQALHTLGYHQFDPHDPAQPTAPTSSPGFGSGVTPFQGSGPGGASNPLGPIFGSPGTALGGGYGQRRR